MVNEEDIRGNTKLFIDSIIESDGKKCYSFTLIVTNYSKIRLDVLYKSHFICGRRNHYQFCLKRCTRSYGHSNDEKEQGKIKISLIPYFRGGMSKYGIKDSKIEGSYSITETTEKTPHAKLQISYIINLPIKENYLEIIPLIECHHHCSVTKQIEELLISEQFSDLKIVVGEDEFNVHRDILALRSPVFATMLETVKNENKIVIEDCDSKAFKEFLHYIYFGKIKPLNFELAMQLFHLSKKYSFETLKFDSLVFLTCNLSKSNVIDVYKLADLHEESELKSTAMDFIVNNLKDMEKMPELYSFKLTDEFYQTLFSKIAYLGELKGNKFNNVNFLFKILEYKKRAPPIGTTRELRG